jgi:hypothetical protein
MSERFSDRVFVEISQGQIGKVVGSKGDRSGVVGTVKF